MQPLDQRDQIKSKLNRRKQHSCMYLCAIPLKSDTIQSWYVHCSTCKRQLILSSIPDCIPSLTLIQLLITLQVGPWVTQMRLQGALRPVWQSLHMLTEYLHGALTSITPCIVLPNHIVMKHAGAEVIAKA